MCKNIWYFCVKIFGILVGKYLVCIVGNIYLEDVVDLVVVDADVKQQAAAVLEVLLAVSAGVGGVQQVLVVLLQQAHEVGAVVVLQQDHCNKII